MVVTFLIERSHRSRKSVRSRWQAEFNCISVLVNENLYCLQGGHVVISYDCTKPELYY